MNGTDGDLLGFGSTEKEGIDVDEGSGEALDESDGEVACGDGDVFETEELDGAGGVGGIESVEEVGGEVGG